MYCAERAPLVVHTIVFPVVPWQRSVDFEMSFWCHHFDQNSNKTIIRISALKVFIASLGLPRSFFGLPVGFFY